MTFISTKIYTGKKHWYFKVIIFHTKNSMYKYRDGLTKDGANVMRKPHRYAAICSVWPSKTEKKQYGALLFTRASARKSGVVSHEIAHATTYWFKHAEKRKNIYKDDVADERYALLLGNLVAQYWHQWYALPKNFK